MVELTVNTHDLLLDTLVKMHDDVVRFIHDRALDQGPLTQGDHDEMKRTRDKLAQAIREREAMKTHRLRDIG